MRLSHSIILAAFLLAGCSANKKLAYLSSHQAITRFGFKQYSGGVMVVHARLAPFNDTLNFILDTGSGGVSLDSTTCVYFNLASVPTDTIVNGVGGTHKVNFVFDRTLQLPGLTLQHLDFHVNDYDLLSSVYGEKIDGVLGYGFFNRYAVAINFDSSFIEVYPSDKIDYPSYGYVLHPSFTTIPIQSVTLSDQNKYDFNFYFDTGAGLCFLISEKFVTDSNVVSPKKKIFRTQAEGMGGKVQMKYTVIKSVKLGKYRFRKVPAYIFNDENNVTSYPFSGGLIGNDLLRRFNLIINYPRHEIFISPNDHYFDNFDYSYTGMAMYFVEGEIVVQDIIPASPADIAGIRTGDIIISVSNNLTNNIMQYKELLQQSNKRIPMIIKRKNELIKLSIRPVSIL